MPSVTVADSFTPQEVANLGGPNGVWASLYDRMWSQNLAFLRDERAYHIHLQRHPPAPVVGSPVGAVTFALRCVFGLADVNATAVGEYVHPACMPAAYKQQHSNPPKAVFAAREFLLTPDGWERTV